MLSKKNKFIITFFTLVFSQINLEAYPLKPVTIFIHGTLFTSWLSWLVHTLDMPEGLNLATKHGDKYVMAKIPYILSKAAPKKHPLETFYMFGWSGLLDFTERYEAAHDLYHEIKNLKIDGPITLIGHSHGGNVAINLAKIAQEHNDNDFKIDRLILLSTPVQQVNAHLIKSKAFKKVYSLFSSLDYEQIVDPQGLYQETKKLNRSVSFFSERAFEQSDNLIQAQIFVRGQSPTHNDFIFENLLRRIPQIIRFLDCTNENKCNTKSIVYVNLPYNQPPHFAPIKEVKFFTPRRRMHKHLSNIGC